MKLSYRQRLPHIQYPGDTFFVTFRLHDSIPKSNLHLLKYEYETDISSISVIRDEKERNQKLFQRRKEYIIKVDNLLDRIKTGPHFLRKHDVADIVADTIKLYDGEYYKLISYCVMSNHVHLLFDTALQLELLDYKLERIEKEYVNLDHILKLIKGRSARFANLKLGRSGRFWEKENFDIFIRNGRMMNNVAKYILNNPVKVGLVSRPRDYLWNYYYEW